MVNPAVGSGFDGPPPSSPAPKVPNRAGEFTAHPAAPLPYRVRARGTYRATPHPEIHILRASALGGKSRKRKEVPPKSAPKC